MTFYKESFFNVKISQENKMLLYNTYSGALSLIDEKTLSDLENIDSLDDNKITNLRTLYEQGFIVENEINEVGNVLQEEIKEINNEFPSEITFVIAITLNCNFNCGYCFEKEHKKNIKMDFLTMESVYSYIDTIVNKYKKNLKVLKVKWFGGEPLLEVKKIIIMSHFLKKICSRNNLEYIAEIVTNGYFFTKKTSKQLYKNGNIKKAQITLDGNEKEYCELKNVSEKCFKQVIKNIVDSDENIKIIIRLNVSDNYSSIKEVTNFLMNKLKKKKKKNVNFYIAEIVDYEKEKTIFLENKDFHLKQIDFYRKFKNFKSENVLKRINCSCGLIKTYNSVIGPEGELYECEHHIGNKTLVVGNCNNFTEVREKSKLKDLEYNKECKECKYLPICLGGCRNNFGSLISKNLRCEDYKSWVEFNVLENYKNYLSRREGYYGNNN